MPSDKAPADLIREQLAKYVGPFTAKNALQAFARQAGTDPSQITTAQVPALLESIGPLLRTLLGKAGADKVIEQVRREFAS